MADIDRKERILPGDTVAHNSEEYIDVLRQVQEEVSKVDNTDLGGNTHTPKLTESATDFSNNNVDISPKPLSIVNKLNGTDSAFGIRVLHTRKKELTKAA